MSLPYATEGVSDLLVFGKITSAKAIGHPRLAAMRQLQTVSEDHADESLSNQNYSKVIHQQIIVFTFSSFFLLFVVVIGEG